VNFAEVEAFCQKLSELAHKSRGIAGGLGIPPTHGSAVGICLPGPARRLPRHFGDKLGSKQANIKNKPYNGGEPGPTLGKAAKVGSYPPPIPGACTTCTANIVEWCRDWFHSRLPGR